MEITNTSENQQAPYQQPMRPNGPVSIGDWFVTILLMAIPLVNLIMLLVWAFGGGTNESKANWAKASLIWMLVGILLAIFFGSALIALFSRLAYM